MKGIATALLLITSVFAATHGEAQSRDSIMAVQARLNQDGFYDGELDGVSGPGTRQALAEYAEQHSIARDFNTVSLEIFKSSLNADRSTPTEYQIEKSRAAIGETLRDAESARFKNERAFVNPKSILICGEVNGKNVYGAYVGFQTYSVTFSVLNLSLTDAPPGEPSILALGTDMEGYTHEMCAMGTSFGAAILNRDKPEN